MLVQLTHTDFKTNSWDSIYVDLYAGLVHHYIIHHSVSSHFMDTLLLYLFCNGNVLLGVQY